MNIDFTPLIPTAVSQQETDLTQTGDTAAFTLSIQDITFTLDLGSVGGSGGAYQNISISLSLSL